MFSDQIDKLITSSVLEVTRQIRIASLTAPMYSTAKIMMFFTLSQLDWTTTKEMILALHLALVQPHFEYYDQQDKVGDCPSLPALMRTHMEDSVQDFGPQHKDVELMEWVQSKVTNLIIGLEHPSYKEG